MATNDEALRVLVDTYMSERTFCLLNQNGEQPNNHTELDAAAAAQALRDHWGPSTVWHDSEHCDAPQDWWDPNLLLKELDERAEEAVEEMTVANARVRRGLPPFPKEGR